MKSQVRDTSTRVTKMRVSTYLRVDIGQGRGTGKRMVAILTLRTRFLSNFEARVAGTRARAALIRAFLQVACEYS